MNIREWFVARARSAWAAIRGIRLIENWRKAHHLASVQWAGVGALFTSIGIAASYATSALSFLPVLSYRQVLMVALAIFLFTLVGRMLTRRKTAQDETDEAGA